MLALPNHIVDEAREKEVFSRNDVPTEERIWAAFLYQARLSYRKVGNVLGHTKASISGLTSAQSCSIQNLTGME